MSCWITTSKCLQDDDKSQKLIVKAALFTLSNEYESSCKHPSQIVLSNHLRKMMMKSNHGGMFGLAVICSRSLPVGKYL